ncbi:MAG: DNA repair protein RecO [Myxococcales bacterium]|nr:DNA repair protein RecO [Myxococcales bacterium]MCB9522215.1 DNA repair protein RecO [Myxococcales bacterium]
MTAPSAQPAVVLRRTPWRDHDLIVELLTPTQGRLTAKAQGARRSTRRFGAALEPGARVRAHLAGGRAGQVLSAVDLVAPLRAARVDLDRFHHLAYVLEIARLASSEGEADETLFGLLVSYLEHLEAQPATDEALAHWELTVLAHLGYGLRLEACVHTGRRPDSLSLSAGGAFASHHASAADGQRVGEDAVAALARLAAGQGGQIPAGRRAVVRAALARLWAQVLGRALRTAAFLPGVAESMWAGPVDGRD